MDTSIHWKKLSDLLLDPKNPRLGLRSAEDELPQADLLNMMQGHSLEELAQSFLENGFWVQEALLCVESTEPGKLVVVEGNRRLAALMLLRQALDGQPKNSSWERLVEGRSAPDKLFKEIPVMVLDSRQSVDIYLGYRHVTGIKEWQPVEKAEYISYLIEERGLSFREVTRKIGSRIDAVRRNYVAYQVFKQANDQSEIDASKVISKFSVLFLALKSSGVQKFLGVDISGEIASEATPVPEEHLDNLREFVEWLFGTETKRAIVKDSREVDRFARALQSKEALTYLRSASKPSLEHAYVLSGGEAFELQGLLSSAAFDAEQSLTILHLYEDNPEVRAVAVRLVKAAKRIEQIFPLEDPK